jgi:hypothetical protein
MKYLSIKHQFKKITGLSATKFPEFWEIPP